MHDALPPQYRIAVTLGSGLGLRQGEVFGLAVEDVDFLRGVVEVRRQVKVLGGNRLVFGLPKGEKTRTVPLPESVATELSNHLATYPRRSITLPWGTPQADKKASAGLILTTRERSALNRNYFNTRLWKPGQAHVGIEQSRDNGMHALRHWYASVLLASMFHDAAGRAAEVASLMRGVAGVGDRRRCVRRFSDDLVVGSGSGPGLDVVRRCGVRASRSL